jgi:hypothetical protein
MTPPSEFEGTMELNPELLRGPSPTPDDQGHYLVAITGTQPGMRVEITSQPATVGRSADQTLVFAADSSLSRRHAQISFLNGSIVVEDLGSTNGTYVDGVRLEKSRSLNEGAIVKMGGQTFKYECRSRDDVRKSHELDRDLERASSYVTALLPEPQTSGEVRTDWQYVPSARLGGDAFAYSWLDERAFALCLIDVSGHGVGAAMHSVTVLNVLRQRALPDVDWRDPASVLATLNDRFQMDSHNGMLLTAWYGVYDAAVRTLAYSAAGHHPAYLVSPGRLLPEPLGVKALMIGAVPGMSFPVQRAAVPAGSSLYLFSDGVFEITDRNGSRWTVADFLPLLTAPRANGMTESERLYRGVQQAAGGQLEDDLSIVVATFM